MVFPPYEVLCYCGEESEYEPVWILRVTRETYLLERDGKLMTFKTMYDVSRWAARMKRSLIMPAVVLYGRSGLNR